MNDARILSMVWPKAIERATRKTFSEPFALKRSLDAIFASHEPDALISSIEESHVSLPLEAFLNPSGTGGPRIEAVRSEIRYVLDQIDLVYNGVLAADEPALRFESLATKDPSVFGDVYLYGKSLWHYPRSDERTSGKYAIVASEDSLRSRLARGIYDTVLSHDFQLRSAESYREQGFDPN